MPARRSATVCSDCDASSSDRGSRTRSGVRYRRAGRRRRRSSACSTQGAELVFVWGATGWCSAARTFSPERARSSRSFPRARPTCCNQPRDPEDIEAAVDIGLNGDVGAIDVGRMKGERFLVMAGAGFDAAMIREADGGLKDRLGRVAYVWTGSKGLGRSRSGEDRSRRNELVRRQGDLHPPRQRRRPVRWHRGVRRRITGRRDAGAGSRVGGRRRAVGADDCTDGRRHAPSPRSSR